MKLQLTVYTDDSLTDVNRVVEADKLKIPYKVAMYVIQSLDNVNLNDTDDTIKFVAKNIDQVDKIIKSTFGLTDSELECIDTGDLVDTAKEIYRWAIGKVNSIGGGQKNGVATTKI